jgi:hypothetical protein
MSHRTIGYTLGAIRPVLAYGITEDLIAINVAASVKRARDYRRGRYSPRHGWFRCHPLGHHDAGLHQQPGTCRSGSV